VSDPTAKFATPRIAAGAMFVDRDRILLVHKTYGNGWDIPSLDPTPLARDSAAARKTGTDQARTEQLGDLPVLFPCGAAGGMIFRSILRNALRRHHYVDDSDSQARERTRKPPGITTGGQEETTVIEDRASADPWRDLPVENPGVRVILTKRRPPAEREQVRQDRQHHARECAGEWREFGQQPGTHLRLVRAGVVRRELRTAEQQTVASLRDLPLSAVSVGLRPRGADREEKRAGELDRSLASRCMVESRCVPP
jgi:hypothetical protein